MTRCSSEMSDEQKELKVEGIEVSSYRSKGDGCLVVKVKCEKCEKMFEDRPEAAIEKIVYGDPLLCLDCDPEAFDIALAGVTIRFGWKRE